MKRDEMIAQIALILNQMLQDRGEASREIEAHTRLLGGELPIDSLDLATVVATCSVGSAVGSTGAGCSPVKSAAT